MNPYDVLIRILTLAGAATYAAGIACIAGIAFGPSTASATSATSLLLPHVLRHVPR